MSQVKRHAEAAEEFPNQVVVADFDKETKNFYKFTDTSGDFAQSYYVAKATWAKPPGSIRVTIEAIDG